MAVLLLALLPAVGVAAPFGTDAALVGFSSTGTSLIFMAYHLVWALAVLAALTTARMPPGHIPLWLYSREPGDQAYFHNVLQAVEKKLDGSLRFCRKCGAFKPDLAHHSRELGLCILCYQHWDLWSNNAIGFYNYKAYLLSLLYGVLAHGFGCALLLPGVLRAWPQADASYAFLAMWMGGVSSPPVAARAMHTSHAHEPDVARPPTPPPSAQRACDDARMSPRAPACQPQASSVCGFACLSLLGSAVMGGASLAWLLFHTWLIARGQTAHTFFRQCGLVGAKPPKPRQQAGRSPFDFGLRGNFARTCGKQPLLWLLPTNQGVEGNGIFFELNVSTSSDPQGFGRYGGPG